MTTHQTSASTSEGPTLRRSCERIGMELANLLRAFAPPAEVRAHFRAARVEVLKGLRAAIDARIERATRDQHKGKSVSIE
jgi:hypothetical protein